MTTNQKIQPALTAEEWAEGQKSFDAVTIAVDQIRFGKGALSLTTPRYSALMQGDIVPAIAALANAALPDDDPRKLVAADIALLDQLIGLRDDLGYAMLDMYPIAALRAKLNALLPPE